jgi:glucose-1-phosphate adenylyltransferase
VQIPEGARIGVDHERDRQRYHVTDSGIVVVGKNEKVDPE